jgi:hypothetical protein
MITQSIFTCPVCDVQLELEDVRNGNVTVFCTDNRCPCRSTLEGAMECTEQQAYDTLCRKVEREITQNDNMEGQ